MKKYYVELSGTGKRNAVTEYVYLMLINAYGYYHLIHTPELAIIKAGKV
jgi:hypothetical protein